MQLCLVPSIYLQILTTLFVAHLWFTSIYNFRFLFCLLIQIVSVKLQVDELKNVEGEDQDDGDSDFDAGSSKKSKKRGKKRKAKDSKKSSKKKKKRKANSDMSDNEGEMPEEEEDYTPKVQKVI